MFHSNRNFAIAYVFLVALPIAGLAGILRSGRNLKAPASIDGVWMINTVRTVETPSSCVSTFGLNVDAQVALSQSGRNFEISTDKITGTGIVEGSTLRASLRSVRPRRAVANCGSNDSLILTATLDAAASPHALSGVLSVPGCPSCESVEFHATKQPATQEKGVR